MWKLLIVVLFFYAYYLPAQVTEDNYYYNNAQFEESYTVHDGSDPCKCYIYNWPFSLIVTNGVQAPYGVGEIRIISDLEGTMFLTAKTDEVNEGIITNSIANNIAVKGESANHYQDIGDVDLRADKEIHLKSGKGKAFHAKKGCFLHAYISPAWEERKNQSEYFQYAATTQLRPPYYNFGNSESDEAVFSKKWNLPNYLRGVGVVKDLPTNEQIQKYVDYNAVSIESSIYNPAANLYNYGILPGNDLCIRIVPEFIAPDTIRLHYASIVSRFENQTKNTPFGRYDILAKVPENNYDVIDGAGWLFTDKSIYIDEYDIFELASLRKRCNNSYNVSLFWYRSFTYNTHGFVYSIDKTNGLPLDLGKDYHEYSVEISENGIRFLFDNYVVLRYPNNYDQSRYKYPSMKMKQPLSWIIGNKPKALDNNATFNDYENAVNENYLGDDRYVGQDKWLRVKYFKISDKSY